jgi:hypothetical protein
VPISKQKKTMSVEPLPDNTQLFENYFRIRYDGLSETIRQCNPELAAQLESDDPCIVQEAREDLYCQTRDMISASFKKMTDEEKELLRKEIEQHDNNDKHHKNTREETNEEKPNLDDDE